MSEQPTGRYRSLDDSEPRLDFDWRYLLTVIVGILVVQALTVGMVLLVWERLDPGR